MKIKQLCAGLFILMLSLNSLAQTLTLNVSGIRNLEGVLKIAVFKNTQQFEDEKPDKSYIFEKSDVKAGKKSIELKLSPGTYAVSILDDEDKSGDMTYRFGIYPLEGVGFSNYILSGLSKPDFADFDFIIKDDIKVNVIMKYF